MPTLYYVPVQGTHGLFDNDGHPQWWRAESDFSRFLLSRDLRILRPDDPFIWSTNVDGTGLLSRLFGNRDADHTDWIAGGAALRYYLDRQCAKCNWPQELVRVRNIIAHSHGLQVVLYACAQGLRVRRLITVGSPIRQDMFVGPDAPAPKALKNIDAWMHIHDTTMRDFWQAVGEIGDGRLGIERRVPFDTVKDEPVDGIGHAGILRDPRLFQLWDDRGWIDFLKT